MGLWFPRPPRRPPRPSVGAKSCGRRRRTGRLRTLYTPTPVPGSRRAATVGMSVLYIARSSPPPIPALSFPHRRRATVRTPELVQAGGRQLPFLQHSGCGRGVDRGHGLHRLPRGTWTKRREGRWLFGDIDFLLEVSALLVLKGRTWCRSTRESQIQKRKKEDGETACAAPPCVGVVAVVIWWPSVCRTISLPLSPHSPHRQEDGRGRAGRLSRSPTAMPGSRTPRWR